MAVAEDRFFEMRAKQLAIVYLTRRSDVKVTQELQSSGGPDLTVSLQEDGRDVGRLLAIEVKAVASGKQVSTLLLGDAQVKAYSSYRFPICLFTFTMDDDQGYWRWIRRPVSNDSENRRLITEQNTALHLLTTEAMAALFDDVRAWYDA
jgi:hypothetical protein